MLLTTVLLTTRILIKLEVEKFIDLNNTNILFSKCAIYNLKLIECVIYDMA